MKRPVRKYINRLKKMAPEEIERELEAIMAHGQQHWDGYYSNCPLLLWFAEERLEKSNA